MQGGLLEQFGLSKEQLGLGSQQEQQAALKKAEEKKAEPKKEAAKPAPAVAAAAAKAEKKPKGPLPLWLAGEQCCGYPGLEDSCCSA